MGGKSLLCLVGGCRYSPVEKPHSEAEQRRTTREWGVTALGDTMVPADPVPSRSNYAFRYL